MGSSKSNPKKRKTVAAEGLKKSSKKAIVLAFADEGNETEEVRPNDPEVKESQKLDGFLRKTTGSIVAKGHLRHLRNHYSIHQKVLMRIPLEGEMPDRPQKEGYTPVFWEFFNYSIRLQASSLINTLLSSIDRAPGQLGPFAWATLTTFQVGCLSVGIVPNFNLLECST
ncbi:hypothetical protein LIER_32165 [Lithospermum erythrorhizon]|uniref:Uncharacterized protein n=1 Tax=Lithospermum erythrorhizon TaxID=34254 RepID=A0AAV3RX43_LITER